MSVATPSLSTDDFSFYLKCAKPLVLNLPSPKDKVLAAAWVKKLMDQSSGDEKTRLDYLKLFLFALQCKTIVPPFTKHPNTIETLSSLSDNKTTFDIIESEWSNKYSPYHVEFSSDLRTYFSCQNIEDFGIHCFYALSKNPINCWEKFDESIFPKKINQSNNIIQNLMEEMTEPKPKEDTENVENPEEQDQKEQKDMNLKKQDFAEKLYKNVKTERKKIKNVVPPLGTGVKRAKEERIPPTWGSNLLMVKDIDNLPTDNNEM